MNFLGNKNNNDYATVVPAKCNCHFQHQTLPAPPNASITLLKYMYSIYIY